MNEKLQNAETELLIEGMMQLKSREEYYNFFEDLLTIPELKSIAVRFYAARLLFEGKTYHEVAEKTGASTATISRISRCLSYGSGGYNTVLQRISRS